MSSDIPNSSQNKKHTSFKNVLPEFCEAMAIFSLRPAYKTGNEYFIFATQILPTTFSLVEEQPPEQMQLIS
jgi:hypothetical protein